MAGNGIIQVLGTRPLRSRLAQLVVPRSGRTALALLLCGTEKPVIPALHDRSISQQVKERR
ncbi:hypothetical protein BO83DRAFT_380190 [Aspergillus eucalypticola CBS 122712]|uniref:Uncharacterized protein n=1 Tax=Aspergillus eucalypticola (strain CBS 122712 / IBT 29274) TaxID=1448314 RepID=A0A317V4I6_ASPEC|nr:uncharacterized protein BO83DRAFT_380190 [Aspergillus eucalypticola CBS 122712]PWY68251.1 hypothetical protein BO83DRAFT_380190 [Aspergillus eucalypticola CBS 122712]